MIEWFFFRNLTSKKVAPTQSQPPINMVNFETSSTQHGNKRTEKNLWIHFALSQKCLLQKSCGE